LHREQLAGPAEGTKLFQLIRQLFTFGHALFRTLPRLSECRGIFWPVLSFLLHSLAGRGAYNYRGCKDSGSANANQRAARSFSRACAALLTRWTQNSEIIDFI
jgi:hypothetical protein